MKLAEALILRADAQNRMHELQNRLTRVAKVQEGDAPAEDPTELLRELDRTAAQLEQMIKQINRTNAAVEVDADRTMTDALAERDVLMRKRNILQALVNTAAQQQTRYGNAEIRMVTTVDVAALQKQVDDLARDYRELDALIQQQNWLIDLIEDEEA